MKHLLGKGGKGVDAEICCQSCVGSFHVNVSDERVTEVVYASREEEILL